MSLPSLFLKETSEGDISLTKLPQDMDLWAETISAKVKELLPLSRGMLIKINFLNKNEELGTATGAISLHDQKLNRAAYIPLIVKNFSLFPLDILMAPKKDSDGGFEIMPLSIDIFAEAMFNSDVFENLERPMDRIQQMYLNPQNLVVNPPFFRNVYASVDKSILDEISDTIPSIEKKAFIENLRENPSYLVGYEKRNTLSSLEKIAASKEVLKKDLVADNANIVLLKDKASLADNSLVTSDMVYNPILAINKNIEIVQNLNDVERNGEKVITGKLNPSNSVMLGPIHSPENYSGTAEPAVEIKNTGSYIVQDKNGVMHKGKVFTNIINFNMKKSPGMLFVSPEKTSLQNKISGTPFISKKEIENELEPTVGMTISFYRFKNNEGLITTPITVKSIYSEYGESYITGITLLGKIVKIKYSSSYSISECENESNFASDNASLRKIVRLKKYYVMPSSFKIVVLRNFCNLTETPNAILEKQASLDIKTNVVKVLGDGFGRFSLQGPDMAKMAAMAKMDHLSLTKDEASFLLLAKNCPLEKCASALDRANSYHRSAYIKDLPRTIYEQNYSDFEIKVAHAAMAQIEDIKSDLTKEASHLDDAQVVDTALSLNFINQNNIDKFISYIPIFEQCSKLLAQILLASRLGIKEIPEDSTSSTMNRMLDVISGLKKLKTLGEKTAAMASSAQPIGQRFARTLRGIIRKNPLSSAAATGAIGAYASMNISKKKNYSAGYKDGAKAMDSYLKSRMGTKMASVNIKNFLKDMM